MVGRGAASARSFVGPRFAMTIRKKIFLLAGVLLALFGVVVGALALFQKFAGDQIGNIMLYELPLSRLLAEFDVDTDRYELRMLRLLQADSLTPKELEQAIAAKREITNEMRVDVRAASDCSTRRPKTRITRQRSASIWPVSRAPSNMSAVGLRRFWRSATPRWSRSRMAGARRHGLPPSASPNSSTALGSDLSEICLDVAHLTEKATGMVLASQRLDTYLSFGLFLVACGVGFGIGAVGSPRRSAACASSSPRPGPSGPGRSPCPCRFTPATRLASLPCPSIGWSRSCARASASKTP